MSKLETKPYKGTRDFLPEEMSVRVNVFERLFNVIEKFGFVRYDGPILESAAIYEAKSGEEIANQQLYHLEDKKGRKLALRPEMTPSVARMIASNSKSLQFPARWYSFVNCHRYENPQRGRVREHWQLNVDIFGSDSIEAEVEIFDIVYNLLSAMGADKKMYKIRVNDRILVEGALKRFIEVPDNRLVDVSMCIDRWEKSTDEARYKMASDAGLNDGQINKIKTLIAMDFDAYCDAAGKEAAEKSRIVNILKNNMSEAPLTLDPLIIRAFNYYTSTVFEVFDTSPENNRSLFGGGRYDDLASLFTDEKIPGIGFGMGDVTTLDFMQTYDLLPKPGIDPQVYVFCVEERFFTPLRKTLADFRSAGLKTVFSFDALSIKAGLKRANRSNARYAVIAAPDEMETGRIIIKDMTTSNQHLVEIGKLTDFIRKEMV